MKRLPPTTPLPPPRTLREREDELIDYLVTKAFELCREQTRLNQTTPQSSPRKG